MTKASMAFCLGSLMGLIGAVSSANAAVLTENFEDLVFFSSWESNWFGQNSNAQNAYIAAGTGTNHNFRGNNPDGLWLGTNPTDLTPITVNFNSSFAGSLSSFALDVAGATPTTLRFFDQDGVTLASYNVVLTYGWTGDPGIYSHYSVTSTTGIGGFSFSGQAQGNVSIDNLVAVTTTPAVPEPSTWAMMMLGFAGVGWMTWRRKSRPALTAV